MDDRHIRVFISSTFKDMHKERELLVKQVFPELRRICAERFVTFTEVDLRWGITEEQTAEGKVLPICLEEIHRCRPFFIGLLGERYGWIPDFIPEEILAKEPWLEEHVDGRTSVTELEILHGVLNNPEMAGHAFFYFRDPLYVESISKEEQFDYIPENYEHAEKLIKLKERIRKSGLPVMENYQSPEALARIIRDQFIELIDRLYSKENVPDLLDREAMGHEVYARGKLLGYVERPVHSKAIDTFVEAEYIGEGLVVTGEKGCGKTALLASWVQYWEKEHPNDYIFQHYFGSTTESTSVNSFLNRLLGGLKRRYDIPEEIPVKSNELRDALPVWLGHAIGKGRIVLVLDGLEQADGNAFDRRFSFLLKYFPPHVRVIVSTSSKEILSTFRRSFWTVHHIDLLDTKERIRIIETYLEKYRKHLSSDLLEKLADASNASNPGFLRTVLEELRQFGHFDKLPDLITTYFNAKTSEELFSLVLSRWCNDFNGDKNLVRNTLKFLWASREGLTEGECLDLMNAGQPALTRQEWAPFFFAIEPHLSVCSGLYSIGHNVLRRVVEKSFIKTENEVRLIHLEMAYYFSKESEIAERKLTEWPWQLKAAGDWEQLKACLTNRELFLPLNNDRQIKDLIAYWEPLREKGIDIVECYKRALEKWLESDSSYLKKGDQTIKADLQQQIGEFFIKIGCFGEAELMLKSVMWHFIDLLGDDGLQTLAVKERVALCLSAQDKRYEAESLLLEVSKDRLRIQGKENPDTLASINNYISLLIDDHDVDNAAPMLDLIREPSEKILGKDNPVTLAIVHNQAFCAEMSGAYDKAGSYYQYVLERKQQKLGPDHPSTLWTMNALADLLYRQGHFLEAQMYFLKSLEGRERVLGKTHPDTIESLYHLALFLSSLKNYEEAESIFLKLADLDAAFFENKIENLSSFLKEMKNAGHIPQPNLIKLVKKIYERRNHGT